MPGDRDREGVCLREGPQFQPGGASDLFHKTRRSRGASVSCPPRHIWPTYVTYVAYVRYSVFNTLLPSILIRTHFFLRPGNERNKPPLAFDIARSLLNHIYAEHPPKLKAHTIGTLKPGKLKVTLTKVSEGRKKVEDNDNDDARIVRRNDACLRGEFFAAPAARKALHFFFFLSEACIPSG